MQSLSLGVKSTR